MCVYVCVCLCWAFLTRGEDKHVWKSCKVVYEWNAFQSQMGKKYQFLSLQTHLLGLSLRFRSFPQTDNKRSRIRQIISKTHLWKMLSYLLHAAVYSLRKTFQRHNLMHECLMQLGDDTVCIEFIETFFYTHLTCSGSKWANAYIRVHSTYERWISPVTELKYM